MLKVPVALYHIQVSAVKYAFNILTASFEWIICLILLRVYAILDVDGSSLAACRLISYSESSRLPIVRYEESVSSNMKAVSCHAGGQYFK